MIPVTHERMRRIDDDVMVELSMMLDTAIRVEGDQLSADKECGLPPAYPNRSVGRDRCECLNIVHRRPL